MANLFEQASDFTKGFFAGGTSITAIVLFLIFIWVRYPDNVKIVLSQIWYILSFIFKKWAGRKYIKNHLEGTLGRKIEDINKEVHGLEADKIKIVMVQDKSREAIIKERTLIIRLQRKENHDENLVNIAMLYAENFLYNKLELHLDQEQKESINLYTVKNLLGGMGDTALQFLHKNYYLPIAKKSQKVQEYFEKLEKIDDRGLFYNVFVQEMVFLGNKVYFRKKPKDINKEIEEFVNFLEAFAKRDKGEIDIDKTFLGTNIKLAFVLVALSKKRELGIPDNYINYIKGLVPQGIESFYVLGWGVNVPFTSRVANAVKEQLSNLEEIHRIKYKSLFSNDESIDALGILFRNRLISELQDYLLVNNQDLSEKQESGVTR